MNVRRPSLGQVPLPSSAAAARSEERAKWREWMVSAPIWRGGEMGIDALERGEQNWRRWVAWWPVPVAMAIGAGVAMMFDPARGRSRRARARDRAAGGMRHTARKARRTARGIVAQSGGLARRAWHEITPSGRGYVDDITLVQRVESSVFRDPDVPKGRLNLDASNGTVVLRGTVERPEQIDEIESAVRKVPGVRQVESLLHLEGTPAPNKVEALEAGAPR